MVVMDKKEMFHVHTYRCGHAKQVSDEAYVIRALQMGAKKITFTDHAPFPGDFFANRMRYDELDEYVASIRALQEKYQDKIKVRCGLEIEYFPSFRTYYEELIASERFDILLLGQHMFECKPGVYNFDVSLSDQENAMGLFNAQIEGLKTEYFGALAHPDRCLQKIPDWTPELDRASKELVAVARQHGSIPLEKNLASMRSENMYREPFWKIVGEDYPVLVGCDAHAPEDLKIWEEL